MFTNSVRDLLASVGVARVAADPVVIAQASEPAGWEGLVYYRLHGSPQMYYSSYAHEALDLLTQKLGSASKFVPSWCIFDNTALGAATTNGLELMELLQHQKH